MTVFNSERSKSDYWYLEKSTWPLYQGTATDKIMVSVPEHKQRSYLKIVTGWSLKSRYHAISQPGWKVSATIAKVRKESLIKYQSKKKVGQYGKRTRPVGQLFSSPNRVQPHIVRELRGVNPDST